MESLRLIDNYQPNGDVDNTRVVYDRENDKVYIKQPNIYELYCVRLVAAQSLAFGFDNLGKNVTITRLSNEYPGYWGMMAISYSTTDVYPSLNYEIIDFNELKITYDESIISITAENTTAADDAYSRYDMYYTKLNYTVLDNSRLNECIVTVEYKNQICIFTFDI